MSIVHFVCLSFILFGNVACDEGTNTTSGTVKKDVSTNTSSSFNTSHSSDNSSASEETTKALSNQSSVPSSQSSTNNSAPIAAPTNQSTGSLAPITDEDKVKAIHDEISNIKNCVYKSTLTCENDIEAVKEENDKAKACNAVNDLEQCLNEKCQTSEVPMETVNKIKPYCSGCSPLSVPGLALVMAVIMTYL